MKKLLALAILCTGCGLLGPANSPTKQTISGVLQVIARGAAIVDGLCTAFPDIYASCSRAYGIERGALLTAADALDVGDERGAACAGESAARTLAEVVELIRDAGAKIPIEVDQGLALAAGLLGPVCRN